MGMTSVACTMTPSLSSAIVLRKLGTVTPRGTNGALCAIRVHAISTLTHSVCAQRRGSGRLEEKTMAVGVAHRLTGGMLIRPLSAPSAEAE